MSARVQQQAPKFGHSVELVISGETLRGFEPLEDADDNTPGVVFWGADIQQAAEKAASLQVDLPVCRRDKCKHIGLHLRDPQHRIYCPPGRPTSFRHLHKRSTAKFQIEAENDDPWSLGISLIVDDDGGADIAQTVAEAKKWMRVVERLNKQEGRQ